LPPTFPPIPPTLIIVRFDPAESADYPPHRVVSETDKPAMTALLDEVKREIDRVYIVDLTGKSFCGTMRLGHLIRLQQALRSTGRVLRIAADHKELLDVFRLTRLNTIMSVSTSLVEAVAGALRPI
jgi:anti-anti-sigma regulatory factor